MPPQLRLRRIDIVEDEHITVHGAATKDVPRYHDSLQRSLP